MRDAVAIVFPGTLPAVLPVAVPLTIYSMTEPARAKGEHGSAPVRMATTLS